MLDPSPSARFSSGERLFSEAFETSDRRARFACCSPPQPSPAPRRPRDYTAVQDWLQRLQLQAFGAGRAGR